MIDNVMPDDSRVIREILESVAKECGYASRLHVHDKQIHAQLNRPGSPVTVNIEGDEENDTFVYLFVRTTSWDFPGERTDLQDCWSSFLAASLRLSKIKASCSLWDVPHPAIYIETEVYARYITIEQSASPIRLLNKAGIERLKELLTAITLGELSLIHYSDWSENEKGEYVQAFDYESTEAWAEGVAKIVGEKFDTDKIQWNSRTNPNWKYYRSIRTNLSIIHAPGISAFLGASELVSGDWQTVKGQRNLLFTSDGVGNAIPLRSISFVENLLADLNNAADIEVHDEMALIPFENYYVASSGGHFVVVQKDCGRKRFEKERQEISARRAQEAVLFPITTIVWSDEVDDEEFELLIRDLIGREPGVQRVRKVSHSRERDSSRDLIADWVTPPLPGQVLEENISPYTVRRVIIQCKGGKSSISKKMVQDIYDMLKHHKAQGYFLAVASQLRTSLFDFLDQMRLEGEFWIDWWTKSEIEDKLREHPDIAAKYPTIIKPKV